MPSNEKTSVPSSTVRRPKTTNPGCKSLSKDSLYAPLSSYSKLSENDNKEDNDEHAKGPSQTREKVLLRPAKVSPAIRETSLITWMEEVSDHYLRGSSKGSALRKRDIEEKVMERNLALTLVGGGINNPLGGGSTRNKRQGPNAKKRRRGNGTMSNKARKRIRQGTEERKRASREEADRDGNSSPFIKIKGIDSRTPNEETVTRDESTGDDPDGESTVHLLRNLNRMWGAYILDLTCKCDTVRQISDTLQTAEMAGALVRIIRCGTNERTSRLVGLDGIITRETENTWHVATVTLSGRTDAVGRSGARSHLEGLNAVVVPKHGSALALRVSVDARFLNGGVLGCAGEERSQVCVVIEGSR